MNLWIDDIRLPPDDGWRWAKNYDIAILLLTHCEFDEVSFDHDLGEGKNGYDIACVIENMARLGFIDKMRWSIHSANLEGSKRIQQAMEKADEYWRSTDGNM